MPIPLNLPNFLNAPILSGRNDQAGNMFSGAINAYQQGQQHQQGMLSKEQQIHAEKMKNALMEKYGEREKLADIGQKEAYAKHLASGAGKGGLQNANMALWRSTPINVRNDILARLRGMGFNEFEAAQRLSAGESYDDLVNEAKSQGRDTEGVSPIYAPTTKNISNMKEQAGTSAELSYLDKNISEATAPYVQTFLGYSPKQIAQALKGENPDEQAKYLAARALQPEMAGARIRVAGGSNAFGSIHDVMDRSLGDAKIFKPLVTPDVYRKMQHYMNEWLQEAVKVRNRTVANVEPRNEMNRERNNELLRAQINDPNNPELNKIVTGVAPDGRRFSFPLSQAENFVRKGGKILD